MNTSELGNIGEIKTISKFIENQIPVFIPVGDGNLVDLVAIVNNKCIKIQVKTTQKVHEDTLMTWVIARQEGFHGHRKGYNIQDIDFFALYCLEADILCFVPAEQVTVSNFSIRTDNYTGSRTKTMRFAKDFSFEKIFIDKNSLE